VPLVSTPAFLLVLWVSSVVGDEVDRPKLYVQQLQDCIAIMSSGGPACGWIVDIDRRWIVTCQHVVGTLDEVEVRGYVYLLKGEHLKAISDLDRYLQMRSNDFKADEWHSRCHQALGNASQADADSLRTAELRL
jgi:hypothetical protein